MEGDKGETDIIDRKPAYKGYAAYSAVKQQRLSIEPNEVKKPASARCIPPGAPSGGEWVQDKHCGTFSWCLGLLFPCICFCPCDHRSVYVVKGAKYNSYGRQVSDGCCA